MYHLIYTKFLIVLGYTIWLSIAAFNNIKDYGTNQFLIRKMVSMMPLEKRKHTGQGLLYRKCCNPKIKQLLFEHYHWCATDNFSVIMALCIIDNNKIIPSYASFQSFDPANCHNGFDCSHGAVACIFVWWTLVWLLVAYGRDAAHPYVAAHYNAIDNYFN